VSLLGRGGMGEVYRARDTRLGRDVAIKVLPAAYSADVDRLARFEREARAAATLNHPNILAVFDVGTEAGVPYVVSELLEGQTLRETLGPGPLPLRKALDYGIQIATGLAAAHEKGIIHRDIKPENLFVTSEGRIKVLDFGLAKLREAASAGSAATMTGLHPTEGIIIGTSGYMSPEQVRGDPVDHRSDIFSFGATFYEMVSGARAFNGHTAIEALNAILNQDPPELAVGDVASRPALVRLIQHCLEKKAGQRFQSAHDLAFALGQLAGTSNSGAFVSSAVPRSRVGRFAAAALAFVAVVAAAGSAYFVGRRTAIAPEPSFRQLTFRRGHIANARFAPDGQTVISSASWDGKPFLLLSTRLDTAASTTLELQDAELLSVSRSGELALRVKGDTLARVPIGLRGMREVLDHVFNADWAPDGTIAAIRGEGRRNWLEYPLGKIIFEDSAGMLIPRVSPDGQLVAIAQQEVVGGGVEWLTIVDRRGNVRSRSQKRRVLAQDGVAWMPDGGEVWFAASDAGANYAIHAMSPDGRERVVHRTVGAVRIQDIAADGRALIVRDVNRFEMSVVDTQTHAERDLTWFDRSRPSGLSRDGHHLIFYEAGGGANGETIAYIRRSDESPAVQLGEGRPIAVSPDAKWVLLTTRPSSPYLTLLPTGTGEMRTLEPGRVARFTPQADWTPDGQRIVFVGNEAGRPLRVFVQRVTGGEPKAVTPEGTRNFTPVVSPDSTMIVGGDSNGTLWKYPLDAGTPLAINGPIPGDVPVAWSADGRSVWVLNRAQTPAQIFRIDLTSGRRSLWHGVPYSDPASTEVESLRVYMSADGRTCVYGYQKHLSDLFIAEGLR
jgi:Tol biopolymer transport system component